MRRRSSGLKPDSVSGLALCDVALDASEGAWGGLDEEPGVSLWVAVCEASRSSAGVRTTVVLLRLVLLGEGLCWDGVGSDAR